MNERAIRSVGLALLVLGGLGGVGPATANHADTAGTESIQSNVSTNAPAGGPEQVGNETWNGTAQANGSTGPFDLSVRNVTRCGLSCRQVTVTLSNEGNVTAENVTVTSTVLAGDRTVVERRTHIDRLPPNESVTRTITVSVGLFDVQAIRQNGGHITVRTVVTSERHTQTFVSERKVL